MSLSCSCDYGEYEYEPGDWYYENESDDFVKSKQEEDCQSCKRAIPAGELCISFTRYRFPKDEKEAKSSGFDDLEEAMVDSATIRIQDHYICEKCGEIYLNLRSLGFECVSPQDSMTKLLREYQATYKPPKL